MKVLFYRYGSICEPDIIETLAKMDVEVCQVTLEVTNKNTTPQQTIETVSKLLSDQKFDAVFSINYYPVLSAVCNIFQIRYISWTVDSPVMELYSNTLSNPWNRTFIFDYADYETFLGRNPGKIFYMPLGVNVSRLKKYLENRPVNPKLAAEVSFVGSLYSEKCPIDRYPDKKSYLAGYMDSICMAQSKLYGCFMLNEVLSPTHIEEFKRNFPGYYTPPEESAVDDKTIMSMVYLGPKATVFERRRLLTLLGEKFDVKLFTASDTAGIPVKNCGTVKSIEEMPLVFRDSRINLNFTTKTIRSGIPQRIFDIMGCGGFVMTNYQTELPMIFDTSSQMAVFTSDEELLNLTEYYLSHEHERADIASAGYEAVLTNHSLENRLVEMFEMAFGV